MIYNIYLFMSIFHMCIYSVLCFINNMFLSCISFSCCCCCSGISTVTFLLNKKNKNSKRAVLLSVQARTCFFKYSLLFFFLCYNLTDLRFLLCAVPYLYLKGTYVAFNVQELYLKSDVILYVQRLLSLNFLVQKFFQKIVQKNQSCFDSLWPSLLVVIFNKKKNTGLENLGQKLF